MINFTFYQELNNNLYAVHVFWIIYWISWIVIYLFNLFAGASSTVTPAGGRIRSKVHLVVTVVLVVITAILVYLTPLHKGFFRSGHFINLWGRQEVGYVLGAAGLFFILWARVTLGMSWTTGGYYVKERHELVVGGPYRLIRHPIYSGIMVMLTGTGLLLASPLFVAWSLAALFPLLVYRAKIEERELLKLFAEEYAQYMERVPGFCPRISFLRR